MRKTSFKNSMSLFVSDLLNIKNLTNMVRGHGDNTKRLPINELASIFEEEEIDVLPEHKGLALQRRLISTVLVILNCLSTQEECIDHREKASSLLLQLLGIVKEVYEINCWVPANTQQYLQGF